MVIKLSGNDNLTDEDLLEYLVNKSQELQFELMAIETMINILKNK